VKSVLRSKWATLLSHNQALIRRHLKGELPLPLSFWGTGFVALIVGFAVRQAADFFLSRTYSPYAEAILLLVGSTGNSACLAIWWIGGWRSATRRVEETGSRFWPALVKSFIVVNVLGQAYIYAAYIGPGLIDTMFDMAEDPQWGPREVRVGADRAQLEVHGGITRSVSAALERALASNPDVRVIGFDSHGGRAGAARAMMEVIRSRGLDTLVIKECSSLCALPFLAGKRRCVAEGARMGFHSPSFGGQTEGFGATQIREQMAATGVSAWFLDKVFATDPSSVWYPSLNELKRAGVVTDVTSEGCRRLR